MNKEIIIIDQREVLNRDFKIYGDKENPLFLAKDVAEWIGHNKPNELINNIDDEEKLKAIVSHSGQNREMWFLTEDGLYEVLMQSRKPIAKAFKKEVKKILKQIRNTGGYIPVVEEDDPETILAKALVVAQKTLERKNAMLAATEKELTEKNKFINQIAASNDCILVRDLAHLITKQNVKIGEKRLWNKLREWKLIQQNSTKPYQKSLEQGLFEVSEFVIQTNSGVRLKTTTRVTGKGQTYIIDKLLKEVA